MQSLRLKIKWKEIAAAVTSYHIAKDIFLSLQSVPRLTLAVRVRFIVSNINEETIIL